MSSTEWNPGMTLEYIEKQVILKAFRHYGGNQTATAAALGITTRTLYTKLINYGAKGVTNVERVESGRNENGMGEAQRGETKEQTSGAVGMDAQSGHDLESTSEVPTQRTVSVPERSKVQEVLPKQNVASSARQRR